MTVYPPVEELIPHRMPMRLVDEIVSEDEGLVRCTHRIGEDHLFMVPGKGVPVYAAFEMMAQAICAHDGLNRRRAGKAPTLGFLLGCRRYDARRDFIQPGETVTLESRQLLEGETASFEARVLDQDEGLIAAATVNVFQPEDLAAFLNGDRPR